MPKVLRLFLKDVRHLWPEILLTLGLSVGYTATEFRTWPAFRDQSFSQSQAESLTVWIVGLLLLSWALLIARAVQDESLVGNQQFWLTRPYGWGSILGAKLLFIACFILLPFFIAQCSLIHRAGISVAPVIPSLLLISGCIFCLIALPLLALSTITSSIGRIILVALGVAVYIGIVSYLVDIFMTTPSVWRPYSLDASIYVLYLAPALCAAVVLVQYSMRRIGISIALLITMVVAVTTVVVISAKTSWLNRPLTALAANEPPPMRFTLGQSQLGPGLDTNSVIATDGPGDVAFRIPLQISIAPGHMEIISGHKLSWELQPNHGGAGGSNSEDWVPGFDRHDASGDIVAERVSIPRSDFAGVAHPMLSVHVSFAIEEFEPFATDVVSAAPSIDVPENGHCVTVSTRITDRVLYPDAAELVCMYAGRTPSLTRVQYVMRPSCSVNAVDGLKGEAPKEEWLSERDLGRDLEWPGVETPGPSISTLTPSNDEPLHLCPGEPIHFTRFRLIRRRIVTVDLPPFDPTPYQVDPTAIQRPARY